MKKKVEYHYNYAFVFYDVGEKRVQKVFKICKSTCHIFSTQYFVEKLRHLSSSN